MLKKIQRLLRKSSSNKLSAVSVVTVQLPPTRVGTAASLEIWMYTCLLCRYPARRIVHQHGIEKVKAVVIQPGNQCFRHVPGPFGKGRFEIWEGRNSGPRLIVRGTQDPDLLISSTRGSSIETTDRKILKISSISESPGKSGFRVHISAKMQPIDHMSTPVEYCRPPSRISGARYHNVTTFR